MAHGRCRRRGRKERAHRALDTPQTTCPQRPRAVSSSDSPRRGECRSRACVTSSRGDISCTVRVDPASDLTDLAGHHQGLSCNRRRVFQGVADAAGRTPRAGPPRTARLRGHGGAPRAQPGPRDRRLIWWRPSLRRRGQVHEALPPRAAPVGPDPPLPADDGDAVQRQGAGLPALPRPARRRPLRGPLPRRDPRAGGRSSENRTSGRRASTTRSRPCWPARRIRGKAGGRFRRGRA